MRQHLIAVICTALFGALALAGPALAQQKTVKACQDEWRADKDANQAAGIIEKAYVDKCRAGSAAAAPTAAPAPTTAAAPAAAPAAGQKTAKACRDEWQSNKAAYQSGGITEKAYVDKCRAGVTVALPAAPAPAPTMANPAAAPAVAPGGKQPPATPASVSPPAAKPAAAPAAAPATAPAATGANEFTAEAQARARCPTDTVVWANLSTKVYHFSGTRNYGTTKEGAYMCEKDAQAQGVRAAKNEKHP